MNFPRLHLPVAHLKVTRQGDQWLVWCEIRRKKLMLTPEEWVRQHLIHYLLHHRHFPKGYIASEVEIMVGQTKRRCDLVIFDTHQKPLILVECKAPEISINQKVLAQAINYNSQLRVPYLILSNGLQHRIAHLDYTTGKMTELDDLPEWGELSL